MNSRVAITTVAALCLVASGASSVQAKPTDNSNWMVKVGVFVPGGNSFDPFNANTSFINTSSQFSAGVEYEYFPKSNTTGLGSAYSVSADYMQVQRIFFAQPFLTTQTASQTAIPVLVNYKYFWQASQNDKGYAGVGLGGFLGDYSGLAYSAFFGVQTGPNLDFELRYIGNGGNTSVGGSTLTSIYGFDIGWHFR